MSMPLEDFHILTIAPIKVYVLKCFIIHNLPMKVKLIDNLASALRPDEIYIP